MACSPVGLFRLMDRKLSPVGTKVRGWFPVKLKFFQVHFQPLRLFIPTAKIMFTFTQLTFRSVPMNRIYLFCLLFDYLEAYGLLMWFLWAWVKNHRNKKIQRPTNICCQVKFDICSIHIFVSFSLLLFSSNSTIVYNSFFRRKQPRTSINALISFARILNYDVVYSERWLSHRPGPSRMFYCVHRTFTRLWNAWLLLSVLVSKLSNHCLYFLNW